MSAPQIVLDHTAWCAAHLEPFRAEWPRGYGVAQVLLFQEAIKDTEIQRACGWNPDTGQTGDVGALSGVLIEFSPLCCRLTREERRAIYAQALGGVWAK